MMLSKVDGLYMISYTYDMNKNLVPSPYSQLIAFELLVHKSEICIDIAQIIKAFLCFTDS